MATGHMEHTDLDALIDDFEESVKDREPAKGYWSSLWALKREITSAFKQTRYPTPSERQAAWQRFEALVDAAQERSAEARQQAENRREASASIRREIVGKADRTRLTTPFDALVADVILLPLTLVRLALNKLLGGDVDQLDEIRTELDHCNEKLQEAWRVFKENKHQMLAEDKQQAYDSLQEAREQLDQAWSQWKGAKAVDRERKHREWLERQERRSQREERHREFVSRVEANIEKLEEKIDKARAALERQETHLEDLREKYDSAWSEGYRDKVSEWIDEAEERISSIRESIEKMETWIDEERAKIR